ncbi:hypothetical protein DRN46_05480 [Thermococci archaeon]|nr:MAG: hypothetical protein DRN46_05480 [Thermococci archaeon]
MSTKKYLISRELADRNAHPGYEWHLEKPKTTTELLLSGSGSARLWTVPQLGKSVRGVLVAQILSTGTSSKEISAYFAFPKDNLGKLMQVYG